MNAAFNKKQFWKNLKILLLIGVVYYGVTWFTGCPFRFFLGISCPGCGMTRAWLAVLHLNFSQAFSLHPLFPLAPLLILCLLLEDQIPVRLFRGILILSVCLFLGVYVLRMFVFPGEPVVFQPEKGIFFRFHSFMFRIP